MFWLVLSGLMLLRLDADGYFASSGVEHVAQARDTSSITANTATSEHHALDHPADPAATVRRVAIDPALAAPPPAHPSLSSATDEPLLHELAALFDALLDTLDGQQQQIGPELRSYITELVPRMNREADVYVVRLHLPEHDSARRRAVRGHAILVESGLQPWLLEVVGEAGARGVSVQRS